jgi:hypothetical protein
MIADPGALVQFKHLAPIQAACGRQVQLFRGGLHGECGRMQALANVVVVSSNTFLIDQEC